LKVNIGLLVWCFVPPFHSAPYCVLMFHWNFFFILVYVFFNFSTKFLKPSNVIVCFGIRTYNIQKSCKAWNITLATQAPWNVNLPIIIHQVTKIKVLHVYFCLQICYFNLVLSFNVLRLMINCSHQCTLYFIF